MKYTFIHILLFFIVSPVIKAEVVDGSKSRLDLCSAAERITDLSTEVELPFTAETKRLLDVYTYSYVPGARRIVNRSKIYYPIYDFLLAEKGLPEVVKNISIVESNLDPWTFSSRGAVGVWQLMKSTSNAHGLIIDKYVDERFDPVKSSTVAFDYLYELNREFSDWNNTLVAYNFGPTALRKAMKYCDSKEYHIIKEALPKESVKYGSRLAAAAYLTSYYHEHNIVKEKSYADFHLAAIPVFDYITFDEIASITGLSKQEIIEYNPSIAFDYLPTNDKGYLINLPLNEMLILSSQKGWSLSNLNHFDFHKSEIEKLLVFHSIFDDTESSNESPIDPASEDETLASDGLRREQVFRLVSLS